MPEEQFTFPAEDFNEVQLHIPADRCEEAADIATMAVPYGIYVEDYRDLEADVMAIAHIDLIDKKLLEKDRTKAIIHLYLPLHENVAECTAFLQERLTAARIPHTVDVSLCRQEDWANNWKQYFHCTPIGERLLIHPTWEPIPETDRVILSLEPGLAFGTGAHETTRLCLRLLERYTAPGCRMLDVGCGSGILAITALLLGAEQADGVDIDPAAVKTSRANADLNGVGDRYSCVCGELAEKAAGPYELIAANIVADVLLRLLPDIPDLLAPGGILLLSGIVAPREQDILDALAGKFRLVERLEEHDWIALAVTAL